MNRSGFLLFMALRGPVRFVLGIFGAIGLLGGLICLILALMGGKLMLGLTGVALLYMWWLTFRGRFEYDRAVLRRVPEGLELTLFQ